MQKILLILAIVLFSLDLSADQFGNLNVQSRCVPLDSKTFRCELILSIPDGFKLPKIPDISVVNPKNLQEFRCDEKLEQIDPTTYRINLTIVAENTEGVELVLDCPLCSDICTIVSKNIYLSLAPPQRANLLWILLLGFLGGLILNLMPCVLPVIIMKLRSLSSREAIWGSIAGNYAGFSAFTGCLAFLKITGNAVGWGMHFQNPYFLEMVTLVLFGLALYSFDMIPLFPSLQLKNSKHGTFLSHFVASIVAAVVAIPCTAPFLGTAAAFAIQGSMLDMCLAFFAIASGFSVPYFLALRMPTVFGYDFSKYSNIFKRIMDSGVILTFLWIFWLLSNYLSQLALVLHVLFFTTLIILLKVRNYLFATLIAAICFAGLIFQDFSRPTLRDADVLTELMGELPPKDHAIVFNITADWCLTCKYNHRVFEDSEVVSWLKNNRVKFIEADITKKNDALLQFIRKHGRVGIPFTIIYGPNIPDGFVLNEIPTAKEVISTLEKATASPRPESAVSSLKYTGS